MENHTVSLWLTDLITKCRNSETLALVITRGLKTHTGSLDTTTVSHASCKHHDKRGQPM